MRLILLGGPGAGKGTQSTFIIERYNIPQISTGDMLRAEIRAGTEIGRQAALLMDQGNLVPDELIIDLVNARIQELDCLKGYLLDGFPRTIAQADALRSNNIKIDAVIEISVDDDEIVRRISGRRTHPGSGRTYHLDYNPPKKAGVDDVTGEPLIQRSDDAEETVRNRLAIYHEQTEPLVSYYRQWADEGAAEAPFFKRVDGIGDVADIREEIFNTLDAIEAST